MARRARWRRLTTASPASPRARLVQRAERALVTPGAEGEEVFGLVDVEAGTDDLDAVLVLRAVRHLDRRGDPRHGLEGSERRGSDGEVGRERPAVFGLA